MAKKDISVKNSDGGKSESSTVGRVKKWFSSWVGNGGSDVSDPTIVEYFQRQRLVKMTEEVRAWVDAELFAIFHRIYTCCNSRTLNLTIENKKALYPCYMGRNIHKINGLTHVLVYLTIHKSRALVANVDGVIKIISQGTAFYTECEKEFERFGTLEHKKACFVDFSHYHIIDLLRDILALMYLCGKVLSQQLNYSKTLLLYFKKAREDFSTEIKSDIMMQITSFTQSVLEGKPAWLDKDDRVELLQVDPSGVTACQDFFVQQMAMLLGVGEHFITGEATKGISADSTTDLTIEGEAIKTFYNEHYYIYAMCLLGNDKIAYNPFGSGLSEKIDEVMNSMRALQPLVGMGVFNNKMYDLVCSCKLEDVWVACGDSVKGALMKGDIVAPQSVGGYGAGQGVEGDVDEATGAVD